MAKKESANIVILVFSDLISAHSVMHLSVFFTV